jgi:hypothetical protein
MQGIVLEMPACMTHSENHLRNEAGSNWDRGHRRLFAAKPLAPVPEPSAPMLGCAGALALTGHARRRGSASVSNDDGFLSA